MHRVDANRVDAITLLDSLQFGQSILRNHPAVRHSPKQSLNLELRTHGNATFNRNRQALIAIAFPLTFRGTFVDCPPFSHQRCFEFTPHLHKSIPITAATLHHPTHCVQRRSSHRDGSTPPDSCRSRSRHFTTGLRRAISTSPPSRPSPNRYTWTKIRRSHPYPSQYSPRALCLRELLRVNLIKFHTQRTSPASTSR